MSDVPFQAQIQRSGLEKSTTPHTFVMRRVYYGLLDSRRLPTTGMIGVSFLHSMRDLHDAGFSISTLEKANKYLAADLESNFWEKYSVGAISDAWSSQLTWHMSYALLRSSRVSAANRNSKIQARPAFCKNPST